MQHAFSLRDNTFSIFITSKGGYNVLSMTSHSSVCCGRGAQTSTVKSVREDITADGSQACGSGAGVMGVRCSLRLC